MGKKGTDTGCKEIRIKPEFRCKASGNTVGKVVFPRKLGGKGGRSYTEFFCGVPEGS